MQIKQVIWDWNGTLLDDGWVGLEVMNEILEERGLKKIEDINIYREIFCFPVIEYYKRAGIELDRDSFEELSEIYIEKYDRISQTCGLRKEAREVLETVKAKYAPQMILSASKTDYLTRQVEKYGILHYFAEILGLDDYYAGSKVELGERWMKAHPEKKGKAVMIGDTTHDAEVAKRMDCVCLLVEGGHQSRQVLETSGMVVLESLSEIPAALKRLENSQPPFRGEGG